MGGGGWEGEGVPEHERSRLGGEGRSTSCPVWWGGDIHTGGQG